MSPEYNLTVRSILPSDEAARKLADAISVFKGVTEIGITRINPSSQKMEAEGENLKLLGETLMRKRLEMGITTASIARELKVSKALVWMVEIGINPRTGKPMRQTLDRLNTWGNILAFNEDQLRNVFVLGGFSQD